MGDGDAAPGKAGPNCLYWRRASNEIYKEEDRWRMEILASLMDNLYRARCLPSGPGLAGLTATMTVPGEHRTHSNLLSQQVSGCAYFFLGVGSSRKPRSMLAFGGRETCNADYFIQRSRYGFHVLEYVAAGAGRVRLGGRTAALGPGSVFAYAPDTRCEIRTDPDHLMLKYFLCLQGEDAAGRLARAGISPGTAKTLAAHAEVRRLLDDLIREGRHHGKLTVPLCSALLEVLLLKLAERIARPLRANRASEEIYLRCRAAINARLEQPVTLAAIAADAGIRPSSVCRLFRRFLGMSPYRYALRRKMTLAAEWLVETGEPVKVAALRVGFSDPYHFSRCFKAVHGVAPSRLRLNRRRARG